MSEFDFAPTHLVPAAGLQARVAPGADAPEAGSLDPWLDVQVVDRRGEWAKIVCANAWSAWVPFAALVDRPAARPPSPAARTTALIVAGMAAGLLATALPWLRPPPAAAWRIPVGVLWESGGLDGGGMSLGLLIAIVIAGIGGTALAMPSPFASRVAGGILLGITAIFLTRAFNSAGAVAFRSLGTGPFLLILSGLAFIVAPEMKKPE